MTSAPAGRLRLRLPATSANLGPGFDAVGLAMSMWLTIEAEAAPECSIAARGRDAEVCGNVADSLILATYRSVLSEAGQPPQALHLRVENGIPLGMGCGSSAAALLAGVALADHFGGLGMTDADIVAEASRLEGHPDNVAACWHGGFTVSAEARGEVAVVSFAGDPAWRLLLAMQQTALATKKARALLPETYARAEAVFNVQRSSLLTAAFASQRLDLLEIAMQDRIHQPYRMEACPLLRALLPFSGTEEIAGVALSGAGPSVLLVLNAQADEAAVRQAVQDAAGADTELLPLRIAGGAERAPF